MNTLLFHSGHMEISFWSMAVNVDDLNFFFSENMKLGSRETNNRGDE
jgi:hypothetical protein